MIEKARILVTGGAGFIGSNLTAKLLELGHAVTVLDNFSTGKRENLNQFSVHPDFHLIEGDIRDQNTCLSAAENVDYIFHEAALGSVPRSIQDPQTSLAVNMFGFLNMIDAARKNNVRRFVYASSSSVYGTDPAGIKMEQNTGKALSPYAVSKQTNELIAENFNRVYGMETIGLRYFNVFGRHQDPDGPYAAVIPKFIRALLRHEIPVINGDGSNSRDFTYIDNVVHANILSIEAPAGAAQGKVYNIACGNRVTLNELYEEIQHTLAEYDPEIANLNAQYGPARKGDIPHSLADISLAEKYLTYHPLYQFKEGLRETVRWYFEQWNRQK